MKTNPENMKAFKAFFDALQTMALKEIEFAETSDQVHEIKKRYELYMGQVNKFIAGKRNEMPYFDENGKVI